MISLNKQNFFELIIVVLICVITIECSLKLKRAAVGEKWPEGKVPYEFSTQDIFSSRQKKKIIDAMKLLENTVAVNGVKCIEFVPRKNETGYLKIGNAEDCYVDYIGYREEREAFMSLKSFYCLEEFIIIHELLHILGFDHEQGRYDRDNYVVFPNNNELEIAFLMPKAHNETTALDTPYDFESLMHYPSDSAFLFSGDKDRILTRRENLLGNYKIQPKIKMSLIDIIQVQRLYNCTESPLPHIDSVATLQPNELESIKQTFFNETSVNQNIPIDRAKFYLNQSLEVCGKSHYWPIDYPISGENHELLKTICLKKRTQNEICLFSIQCQLGFHCFTSPFIKYGVCSKEDMSYYEILKTIMFKYISIW